MLQRFAILSFLLGCGHVGGDATPDATTPTPDGPPTPDAPSPDAPPVAPVCGNLAFTAGPFLDAVNAPGQQDAFAGVSGDGRTLLSQRRAVCSGAFQLMLTDGLGVQVVTRDITALPGLAQIDGTREGAVTLTADGLSLLGVAPGGQRLALATRSAIGATDFALAQATADFAAITVAAPGLLNNPVLSADRLELHYQLFNVGAGVDGIYESVRASTSAPFPAGTRAPELEQAQFFVTAISSDRLALFLEGPDGMVVLTRARTSDAFANPNGASPPPHVPGFRTRPTGDCQTLLGTCAGGCLNEDTCTMGH